MHQLDRARFELRKRRALELGELAELDMARQRKELGLPIKPKGEATARANLVHLHQAPVSRLSSEKPSVSDPKQLS